jgi:hypothetical protein
MVVKFVLPVAQLSRPECTIYILSFSLFWLAGVKMCEPMGMQGCAWACPAAARVPESRGNSTRLQRKGGQRWVQLAITLINKKIKFPHI